MNIFDFSKIQSAIAVFSVCILTCNFSFAGADESSFTPTSILVPIRSITLEDSSRSLVSEIFKCSGSSDAECFVDVACLLYTSPSPRDRTRSRMPSSA